MDSSQQNPSILIVEDDPLLAITLRRQVERIAPLASVHAVESCADAESSWTTTKPDLVFMDYRLPDGFGTDVILKMRRQDQHACIVCMTAESESIPLAVRDQSNIQNVYTKPVPRENIESILQWFATRKTNEPAHPATKRKPRNLGRFRLVSWHGPLSEPRIKRLARATRRIRQPWIVLETPVAPADERARESLFAFSSWLSANGGRLCMLAATPATAIQLKESVAMLIDVFTSSDHIKADQLRLTGFAERQLLLQALTKDTSV